jgi:NADH:ubiquinone oxidoreductase subunit E/NAD-dependent dihydropyrimidine dehydrogenase PreA subunit
MSRIGVFVCWCGSNIAGSIDVDRAVEIISEHPDVAHAENYVYMCSDPGQEKVLKGIEEHDLDGVIVSACSPTLHEGTFRKVAEKAGLNPYRLEIANIREHCSWVHQDDRKKATDKAVRIISSMIEKVKQNSSLFPIEVPLHKKALVVGGGISGMQTALDIANSGYEVLLVEKRPTIGGHMLQLSETFPTLDCSQCIMTPKMVEVNQNEKIRLFTYSEIEDVSGYIGNYNVKIRKKPRYIDEEACTGCGLCTTACLVHNKPVSREIPDFSQSLTKEEYEKIDEIIDSYKGERGILIQILQDVNREYRYLPGNILEHLSQRLEIPLSQIYHVATFYNAFSLTPRGKNLIRVCMGTACHARGAQKILEEFERRLEIPSGATTPDYDFTLETVNCLGCCALGPVAMVNDDYYSMTTGEVTTLIEKYSEQGKR